MKKTILLFGLLLLFACKNDGIIETNPVSAGLLLNLDENYSNTINTYITRVDSIINDAKTAKEFEKMAQLQETKKRQVEQLRRSFVKEVNLIISGIAAEHGYHINEVDSYVDGILTIKKDTIP